MAKSKGTHINTGGGAYIGGAVNTGGGKFIGRDDYSQSGLDGEDVKQLFDTLYTTIDVKTNLTKADKADLKQEIEELRQELTKKAQADETFLMRHLRNIGRMAPDILEVTIATITNPVAGFGMVAKKIAEKFKASTG
jgi:predicted transport protein